MRHTPVSVDKTGTELYGCMADSMVAHKIGLLMWSTGKSHKDKFADKLGTI